MYFSANLKTNGDNDVDVEEIRRGDSEYLHKSVGAQFPVELFEDPENGSGIKMFFESAFVSAVTSIADVRRFCECGTALLIIVRTVKMTFGAKGAFFEMAGRIDNLQGLFGFAKEVDCKLRTNIFRPMNIKDALLEELDHDNMGIDLHIPDKCDGCKYREHCIKKGDNLPENLVIALTEMANTLKQKWGCHVDIEWCYCQGKVYLIQVRPVSVIASKKTKKISSNRIYSISEIDNVDCEGAGLEPRIRRWKGKKQHFNRCFDSLEIKHLEWFFVENYQDNLQTEVENRLQKFSGKFVTLAINETLLDVVKKKEEVIPFMQQYGQLEDKTVISFRDVPMNDISVISTYNGEGSVYIEVIDGIMKGLKTGELQASVYEVDSSGNIIASREYHEKKKYVIEFPSGDTFMVENENNSFSTYEDKFVDIAMATNRLYENGQVGAIEW